MSFGAALFFCLYINLLIMGNKITNWAKEIKVGNGVAKAVLLCLADEAFDDDRGFVSVTQQQIAGVIEFDKRSVMRGLDFLEAEAQGLIRRIKTKNETGKNNPNRYQILCPPETFVEKEKPGDRESPIEPDLVTESHLDTEPSDRESLLNGQYPEPGDSLSPLNDEKPGDSVSPSTPLKDKELLINSLSSAPPRARQKLSVDEAAELLEREQPGPDNPSPTKAIKIFREVFPLYQLEGQQLDDFAKVLPEIEESVWRENLRYWRLGNYQANNIGGMIERYHDKLAEFVKKRTKNQNGSGAAGPAYKPDTVGSPSKEKDLDAELHALRDLVDLEGRESIEKWKGNYPVEDWEWLMEQLGAAG